MNYKSFLFFIIIAVVSITVASYRRPGKKAVQKGWAPLSGSVDTIKVVCLPYNSPEIRTGADNTMRKNGAIAKFTTTKDKKSYVCYVKFFAHKDIASGKHAATYKCATQLNEPSNCSIKFSGVHGADELRNMWNSLSNQAVMFDKLQPAVQYLNQDPTVEQLPVYMGGTPGK